ncbi:hypothetical protein LEMLEM_LOCUS3013, partial [Lemmus lemmus]
MWDRLCHPSRRHAATQVPAGLWMWVKELSAGQLHHSCFDRGHHTPELHLLNRSLPSVLVTGETIPSFPISFSSLPVISTFPHHCKASWMRDSVYSLIINKNKKKSIL